jgi:hypothetical protein
LAHSLFDVFRRHPNVAPLLVEQIPIGPNAMAQREQTIALLLESGFEPSLAAQACATLARFVLGFATQLSAPSSTADGDEVWQTLDPRTFPATASVADHLPVPLEQEFAFGLELIINGLSQVARDPSAVRRRASRRLTHLRISDTLYPLIAHGWQESESDPNTVARGAGGDFGAEPARHRAHRPPHRR